MPRATVDTMRSLLLGPAEAFSVAFERRERRRRRRPPIRVVSLVIGFSLLSCTTMQLMQPPGESSIQAGVYNNDTYRCTVRFPNPAGWRFVTEAPEIREFLMSPPRSSLPWPQIFMAFNDPRLLFLVLMREDGGFEMSNADYQLAVKTINDMTGSEELSLEERVVNGNEALVWTVKVENTVVTRVFFRRGTENFSLSIGTPEGAFERRQEEIQAIIRSFDFF